MKKESQKLRKKNRLLIFGIILIVFGYSFAFMVLNFIRSYTATYGIFGIFIGGLGIVLWALGYLIDQHKDILVAIIGFVILITSILANGLISMG